ncbi:MAG: hypothetical protein VYE68_06560 [Acidobacteriota bacterium]|nr:hypothetical protein [Acidobacteriota bacterium]
MTDVDNDAERDYLNRLSERLRLLVETGTKLQSMLEPGNGEEEA